VTVAAELTNLKTHVGLHRTDSTILDEDNTEA